LVATTTSLIINACSNAGAAADASSFAGFVISTVAFDNATGLATAGSSITMSGTITLSQTAGSGAVFDTTTAGTVVSSVNSLTATVTAATGVSQVNVSASPAFARLVNTSLTVLLSTVNITQTGAFAADLSTPIVGAAAVGAANFIRLTSSVLSDDAVTKAEIQGLQSTTPTQFGAGNVTFTIAAASIQSSFQIVVNFNGTAAIDNAAAGTVDVSFAAIGAASQNANNQAPAGVTGGGAAGLSRSGLSININGIQPNIAQGLTYQSYLRIVNSNTSTSAGVATVVLRNNDTGVILGTYTSPSIPAGGSVQVSAANLESGAGITPSASVLYQATISGAFNGYVQHVTFNPNSGAFSDLSAAPRTN
jgi:hypothetical protein